MQPYTKHSNVPVYRVDLQYIGEAFHGWQSQPSGKGVQNHLERAFASLLKHPVQVIGASRTDTGVHAQHQVAIVRTPVTFALESWLRHLHGLLPASIGINRITEVPKDFHPAYSSTGKAYCYRLWLGSTRSPQVAPYAWQVYAPMDTALLRQEAAAFVGTHDFTSFCAGDSSSKTKQRTIVELQIEQRGPLVEIWMIGPGFLKQMLRIMVGTLVDVATFRKAPGTVATLLGERDRRLASRTAPAQGLSLVEVFYANLPDLAELRRRQ